MIHAYLKVHVFALAIFLSTQASAERHGTLRINTNAFDTAFNQFSRENGTDLRAIKTKCESQKAATCLYEISRSMRGITVGARIDSKATSIVLIFGAENLTAADSMESLVVYGSVIGILSPQIDKPQRAATLRVLMKALQNKDQEARAEIDGISYTLTVMPNAGIWFTAEPTK